MLQTKLSRKAFLIPLVLVLGFAGVRCSQLPHRASRGADITSPFAATEMAKDRISVMAYNVENLFDTEHDEGKIDFTFLPLSKKQIPEIQSFCRSQSPSYRREECLTLDWNERVLEAKMRNIADSILQIRGRGPDVLIVEEVENIKVLRQLNEKYLKEAGYQTVTLVEGDDPRGIDVGLLSRFPLAGDPQLHRIKFTPDAKVPAWTAPRTRGILDVPLKLPNGETLHVLGFHFPSQANPHQEREDAIDTLVSIVKSKGADALVVAGGDSNITSVDDEDTGILTKKLAVHGAISHQTGCSQCKGTHNYRNNWDYLDWLFFSKALVASSKTELVKDSIITPRWGQYQMQPSGKPDRWDSKSMTGVSDHLPIYAEIVVR